MDEQLTASLQALLESIGGMGDALEAQLARLIEDQRARSPFAYLMEPADPVE